jgi:hypothetical protein
MNINPPESPNAKAESNRLELAELALWPGQARRQTSHCRFEMFSPVHAGLLQKRA